SQAHDPYDARYFAAAHSGDEHTLSAFLDRLLARLGPARARHLFDSGCGAGLALEAGHRAGFTVAGCDRSETACQLSRSRGLAVARAAAEALPISPASNDVVVLLDVLAHVDDPRRAVAEAVAALRPGGRLLVKTPV